MYGIKKEQKKKVSFICAKAHHETRSMFLVTHGGYMKGLEITHAQDRTAKLGRQGSVYPAASDELTYKTSASMHTGGVFCSS